MAKRKTAAAWRRFLRVLARTGNARAAACAAGMDVGTAYDRRIKVPAFAARWVEALAEAKARGPLHHGSHGPPPRSGEELVLRRTKHGDKLVRAAPGRWNAKAEAVFLAELRRTGCVRRAARACGFSTNALYKRRENYPDFAARWAAAEAAAKERIPALLSAATIASLDPEVADADLPPVDIDQAIAIARLKYGEGAAGRRGRGARPERPIEAVRASILQKLDAIEAHEKKAAARKKKGAGDAQGNGDSRKRGNGDSHK
jgi:hypothetical protein